jgi:L-rhamnose isomerase/sugar isomerase
VQAHLVDRDALSEAQEKNDALMASEILKRAFRTDVEPLLATVRMEKDAAIDPVAAYRACGYRAKVAAERPKTSGSGGGIV